MSFLELCAARQNQHTQLLYIYDGEEKIKCKNFQTTDLTITKFFS